MPDTFKILKDDDPMPWGKKYAHLKLIQVPADYLLWVAAEAKWVPDNLREYIEQNKAVLIKEVEKQKANPKHWENSLFKKHRYTDKYAEGYTVIFIERYVPGRLTPIAAGTKATVLWTGTHFNKSAKQAYPAVKVKHPECEETLFVQFHYIRKL